MGAPKFVGLPWHDWQFCCKILDTLQGSELPLPLVPPVPPVPTGAGVPHDSATRLPSAAVPAMSGLSAVKRAI
jgi:hypothetical protein